MVGLCCENGGRTGVGWVGGCEMWTPLDEHHGDEETPDEVKGGCWYEWFQPGGPFGG